MGKVVAYAMQYNAKHNPKLFDYIDKQVTSWLSIQQLNDIPNKGSNIKINGRIQIIYPKGLRLGNNIHIGNNCYFFARGGLAIGDNTHISSNVSIYTANHRYEGNALPYDSQYVDKSVTIGRNVWIGMNVNIIPGVTIGDGSVIAMGATISKEVPPMSVVAGPGHRIIKNRDRNRYKILDTDNLWSGSNGRLLLEKDTREFYSTAKALGENLFFVLGTGRSGSTTISDVLSKHENIICKHEPKLELVKISTDYAHGIIDYEQAKNAIHQLYCDTKCYPNVIYGESDQKLSNLVDVIHEVLPQAKFVWLIRNPIDTINSMLSRGWFSNNELFTGIGIDPALDPLYRDIFSQYRIQADLAGLMPSEEWREMSAFDRNCWYWNYWNSNIEQQLNLLPDNQIMFLKLEEFGQSIDKLLQFLGTDNRSNIEVEVSNRAFDNYRLKTINEWTPEMKDSFVKICGTNYEKWYQTQLNQINH
ncbi:MAG: sulfotransferase [Sedimenticola sp.]